MKDSKFWIQITVNTSLTIIAVLIAWFTTTSGIEQSKKDKEEDLIERVTTLETEHVELMKYKDMSEPTRVKALTDIQVLANNQAILADEVKKNNSKIDDLSNQLNKGFTNLYIYLNKNLDEN